MLGYLHIGLPQKITIGCVITLGLFIIALDVLRFGTFMHNPSAMNDFLVWNIVECAALIILANVPTLRPLLFKEEFMRGGNIRGVTYISRAVSRKHRRAQSTPWCSSPDGEQPTRGRNRLSAKTILSFIVEDVDH
jgi:hypothetical protein